MDACKLVILIGKEKFRLSVPVTPKTLLSLVKNGWLGEKTELCALVGLPR